MFMQIIPVQIVLMTPKFRAVCVRKSLRYAWSKEEDFLDSVTSVAWLVEEIAWPSAGWRKMWSKTRIYFWKMQRRKTTVIR